MAVAGFCLDLYDILKYAFGKCGKPSLQGIHSAEVRLPTSVHKMAKRASLVMYIGLAPGHGT
jgi:hypothetical protein